MRTAAVFLIVVRNVAVGLGELFHRYLHLEGRLFAYFAALFQELGKRTPAKLDVGDVARAPLLKVWQ